ncbi:MAG: serine protease [Deltaproteobacteria bacterium]|nr:serine protease [Deltaproteobacteria bacterium]
MKRESQGILISLIALFAVNVYAKTATEVFDQVSPSLVLVRIYDSKVNVMRSGTGVVVSTGVIATNCRLIDDAAKTEVEYQGQKYIASLRHCDLDRDVCSLTVSKLKAPVARTGSTGRLKVGARVFSIGAIEGINPTLSEGTISSVRPGKGGQHLQISVPIPPGSSGGGLFDEAGRFIGFHAFYVIEGQQLDLAIPVEWITELPKRHNKLSAPAQPGTIDCLNKAVALENKRDWDGLITHCVNWTKVKPEEAVAWYNLANAYRLSGQTAKGIDTYRQFLRINPEDAEAWNNLGIAYGKSAQTIKAIEAYQKALTINPEYAEVWYNLGNAYRLSGQKAKEIEAYEKALKINPEDAEAWNNLGIAYGRSGRTVKEIEAYKKALKINPEDAEAWTNLGIAYDRSGQTAKAIEAYEKVLKINPEDAETFTNLGVVYRNSGLIAKAIETFRQALTFNPEHARAWYNLGIAYRLSGQPAKAGEAFQKGLAHDPAACRSLEQPGSCSK